MRQTQVAGALRQVALAVICHRRHVAAGLSHAHAHAIGMQLHGAGRVGQFEIEELLGLVELPKQQVPAVVSRGRSGDHSLVKEHVAGQPTKFLGGGKRLHFFARFEIEHHDQRRTDAGKCVRHFGNAAAGQVFAIGAEGDAAHAADIGAEARVVLPQRRTVELPQLFAGGDVPRANDAFQVAGHHDRQRGMKGHVVNVVRVTQQRVDQRAVRRVPQPDQMVVARGGEQIAIGTDSHGAHPTFVRVDGAQRRGRFGGRLPEDHFAVVPATVERIASGMKRQTPHPTAVSNQRRLFCTIEFPALNGKVLRRGKDVFARRIEPAREQRTLVLELADLVSLLGGDGGRGGRFAHASNSVMAEAAGSATGISRPPASIFIAGSTPTARRYVWNKWPWSTSRSITSVPLSFVLPMTAPG